MTTICYVTNMYYMYLQLFLSLSSQISHDANIIIVPILQARKKVK